MGFKKIGEIVDMPVPEGHMSVYMMIRKPRLQRIKTAGCQPTVRVRLSNKVSVPWINTGYLCVLVSFKSSLSVSKKAL